MVKPSKGRAELAPGGLPRELLSGSQGKGDDRRTFTLAVMRLDLRRQNRRQGAVRSPLLSVVLLWGHSGFIWGIINKDRKGLPRILSLMAPAQRHLRYQVHLLPRPTSQGPPLWRPGSQITHPHTPSTVVHVPFTSQSPRIAPETQQWIMWMHACHPILGRLRQEGFESEASLGYVNETLSPLQTITKKLGCERICFYFHLILSEILTAGVLQLPSSKGDREPEKVRPSSTQFESPDRRHAATVGRYAVLSPLSWKWQKEQSLTCGKLYFPQTPYLESRTGWVRAVQWLRSLKAAEPGSLCPASQEVPTGPNSAGTVAGGIVCAHKTQREDLLCVSLKANSSQITIFVASSGWWPSFALTLEAVEMLKRWTSGSNDCGDEVTQEFYIFS